MEEHSDRRKALADGFWVDDWFVEPMLNRMSKGEDTVQVEPKVMEVLLCMAEQPDETVTKEAFMERVWADTVVTDDVLSRCISELRKIFRDDSRNPDYIETIRKKGYRLIAPVTLAAEGEEAAAGASPPDDDNADAEEDASQNAAAGASSPLKRVTSRLSSELETISSSDENSWVVVAGGSIRRRWLFAIAGVLVAIAVVVGLIYNVSPFSPFSSSASSQPLNAVPFTSFPGQELDPALSPDGQQIAFSWDKESGENHNLYLLQRGVEDPLQLTSSDAYDWSPSWSPDGRFVAFVRHAPDAHSVHVVSSIGGNEREIVRFPNRQIQGVAWSPDTSRQTLTLSLQQAPHQPYSLYRVGLQSDSLRQLTTPPSYAIGDQTPIFSPDGSQIAFKRTLIHNVDDVFVMDAGENPEVRQVTTDSTAISGIDWLPNGEEILFASHRGGSSGLWRVPASGGDPTWVTTAGEGTNFTHPSLSRSGKRLAYAQRATLVNIWKVSNPTNYSSLSTTRLISSTQWDRSPHISPDGERVAFASRRSGHPEIWTADANGENTVQVTSLGGAQVHSPQWSPDASRIAFVGHRKGSADIFVADPTNGMPERITKHSAEDLVPRWSHDGSGLYFTSNRSGDWESWHYSFATDSLTQVTRGGSLAAQEHPDGDELYFVHPDTTGIWAVPLDTAQRTFPIALAGSTASTGNAPQPERLAPDFLPSDYINWTVAPRGIYFLRRDEGASVLSFYRFSTGQTNSLFLLQDVAPESGLSVAPSGDWFLYAREERHASDILLVEDF